MADQDKASDTTTTATTTAPTKPARKPAAARATSTASAKAAGYAPTDRVDPAKTTAKVKVAGFSQGADMVDKGEPLPDHVLARLTHGDLDRLEGVGFIEVTKRN